MPTVNNINPDQIVFMNYDILQETFQCYDHNQTYIGLLTGSVGKYGNSTGIFQKCQTTHPLTELGFTHTVIDGGNVAKLNSWE